MLEAFWRDRKGTGAIEFTIVLPLLIVAYVGAFEISAGFNIARKVARAASTVADMTTRDDTVQVSALDGMPAVVRGIIDPFALSAGSNLKVTGIKITAPGVGVVAWSRGWSWKENDKLDPSQGYTSSMVTTTTPYVKDSTVAIPNDVSTMNAFIVRTELTVPYTVKLLNWSSGTASSSFNISKTYYLRQRIGDHITCSGCGT
ncbi:hypothetical protein ADU59_04355 [Pararhizobium polonicum]|uniref:TadE-like domain-containing protein n=2 Tax=Pararhizobium polonicum TaxID=1612624 RepID=A0A1C7P7R6_9HYPH|nr:hypothetical protein ADU59_04355 [Pararhizobium polonicum]